MAQKRKGSAARPISVLRTPEECFHELPDYPFAPNYLEVPGPYGALLRMHYVDEGPRNGRPVLLLHGEPTWSFLYRKVIPHLVAAGLRAIAPDLIGFGRSDKPSRVEDHTYFRHIGWVQELVEHLDLRGAVVVGQDWGGPIGFSVLCAESWRFAAAVAANTVLPEVRGEIPDWPGRAIIEWIEQVRRSRRLRVGEIVRSVCRVELPDPVVAAYDAPFPTERYKAGPRALPKWIPLSEDHPAAAHNARVWECLEEFERPFLTVYGDADPITAPWAEVFRRRVPGAQNQPHRVLRGAGHFLQEDAADELGRLLAAFATGLKAET